MVISIFPRTIVVVFSEDEISYDAIKEVIASNTKILSIRKRGNNVRINAAGSCEELYRVIYNLTVTAVDTDINIS